MELLAFLFPRSALRPGSKLALNGVIGAVLVVQASQPDAEVERILSALGISFLNPVLRVTRSAAA